MCNEEFKFTHHPIMDELDMSPDVAALLYTSVIMEQLIYKGLVSGPEIVTPAGKEIVQRMKAAGYQPTREELELCTKFLASRLVGEDDA